MRPVLGSYQRQILPDHQVEAYKRDSYVVLNDLFTPDEKHQFVQTMSEIEKWPVSDDKWFTYYENVNGKKRLSRLEAFYEHHEGFKKVIEGKIGKAVGDLLEEEAVVYKDKINFKYPGGIGYIAHQDGLGYTMFGHTFHMSILIPADPMTLENGCLQLVAGDWRAPHFLPQDENGDIKEEIAREFKWDPVICDAGTVVMFNSYVPHMSETNRSKTKRRAAYLTFNGVSQGDARSKFYNLRREMYPSDHLRDPEKNYSEGIELFSEQILEMASERIPKSERKF